jgi:hypothetical protein
MVNGSNNTPYGDYNLVDAGASLPAGGYLVLANAGVIGGLPAGTLSMVLPANGLQNGAPDGVRIIGPAGFVDGLSYEGNMPGVGEGMPAGTALADIADESLSRCPNGVDTNSNTADFVKTMVPSPGAANTCP